MTAALQSSKTFDSRTKLCELNLDTVLSSTSYRNLMRQTFGTDGSIMPSPDGGPAEQQPASRGIPTITRRFEESYMREPIQGERECARGMRCECRFIDPSNPFVAVEFLTLDEIAEPPAESQLCVVCSRKETQFLYYDMVFNRTVYNAVIQRYGNMSGAGEYAPECLLRCTKSNYLSCMPKPIMSHQRNHYMVVQHPDLNVLCLKQVRVSPEDYVTAASLERPESTTQKSHCAALSNSLAGAGGSAASTIMGAQRSGKSRGF